MRGYVHVHVHVYLAHVRPHRVCMCMCMRMCIAHMYLVGCAQNQHPVLWIQKRRALLWVNQVHQRFENSTRWLPYKVMSRNKP